MFAKLLKHELKSTGSLLGILSPAVLVLGVVGGFVMRGVMNEPAAAQQAEAASILAGLLLPFVFVTLFSYAIGGEIYLAVQFYKRKFTDQGYLTFTLPVSGWQIYLSSLVNMMLWSLIILAVMFLSIAAMIFVAVYDTEAWYMMQESFRQFPVEMGLVLREYGLWGAVYGIASFVFSNVLLITGITLGCVTAKKHKILASIGWNYLLSAALSGVTGYLSAASVYGSELDSVRSVYMTSAVIYAAAAVAGSVLTVWLMNKKLNLP